MRVGLTLVLLVLWAARAAAQTTSVPFNLTDNRVLLQCSINGVSGFTMIFDTGANGVLVTPQAARRLHLHSKFAGYLSGAGRGAIRFGSAQLHDLGIGSVHFGRMPAIVADLESIRRNIGFAHLDGVIGYDVLGSRAALVDMDRRTFTMSASAIAAGPGARSVGIAIQNGFITVPAVIGGHAGQVVLDTGDRSSLTVFNRFAQTYGFYATTPAVHDVLTGFGIGGPVHADVFRTDLSIFGSSVSDVLTRAQRGGGGAFATSAGAGSVGMGFLRRFNVIYDVKHRKLTIWPSRDFTYFEPYDPAGMWMSAGTNGPVVTEVTRGGPAARAGLHPGDRIVAVNGVSTVAWQPPQLREWLSGRAGSAVAFRIDSVSGTREAGAILEDPLPRSAQTLPRHGVFGAAVVDKPAGLTVARVIPNSPAEAAGIKAGDIIKSLAGVATPDVASFLIEVHSLHAGQRAVAAIVRSGTPLQIPVTLGRPADESDPDVTTIYGTIDFESSLRRTLITVPHGAASRLPGVLLIGGIGCYSIDVASNPNDAYMRLTHDLSRAGFATMRLEKSGVGDSQGPPCSTVDFLTEERSYAAALAALRQDPHVDPQRIYLLGHSIGTVVAPYLATTQRVAGVIVSEAVGRDWLEYEVRNVRRQLELDGSSPADVDAKVIEKQECMYRLLLEKQSEPAIEHDMPACKEANGVYPVDSAYVQQLARLNIVQPWTRLNVPLLIVYGKSDFVTEESDHARIAQIANAAHPGTATFREIDGMDHLLFRAASPKAALTLYQSASREYDTDLSRIVIDWLRIHAQR